MRADTGQFMYYVDAKEKKIYRNRDKESENQWVRRSRCSELNLPTSSWTVDKDADPDEIEAHLHGDEAKKPFVTVVFVDKTAEEHSAAFDRLCELARRQKAGETEKSENELAKRKAVFRIGKKTARIFSLFSIDIGSFMGCTMTTSLNHICSMQNIASCVSAPSI